MTDPIRAALEAAACALCREAKSCRGDCGELCLWRVPDVSMPACAATAIAAFNRTFAQFTTDEEYFAQLHEIADAALAAAKDQGND